MGPLDGRFVAGELPVETVLKAGDSYLLFELSRNDESMSLKLAGRLQEPILRIRIIYQATYGNGWKYDWSRTNSTTDAVSANA